MKTTAISNGLSDFHKMTVTIMKTTFPKVKPRLIQYRKSTNYDKKLFGEKLRNRLAGLPEKYEPFRATFMDTLIR